MKPEYKIIIAGSRTFKDYKLLKERLNQLLLEKIKTHNVIIVCGMARGADKLGKKYGLENNLPISEYPAQWDEHGKKAGYLRNLQMAEDADALVAFWNGKSPGTKHMIDIALLKGLQIRKIILL